MTTIQCISCKHYRFQQQCDAFPERIPQKIFDGTVAHDKKYKGQKNSIVFEEIEE